MEPDDEKIRKIENALRDTYRKEYEFPARTAWRKKVMAHVFELQTGPSSMLDAWDIPVVWKAAAAACALAVLVLIFSLKTGMGIEFDAAGLFFDDPVGLSFLQPLFV